MSRSVAVATLGLVAAAFALAPCAALLPGCAGDLWPDPAPIPQPAGACARAEEHLRDLGCDDAADLGGGFGAFCERSAKRAVDMHPTCVAAITSCDAFKGATKGKACP